MTTKLFISYRSLDSAKVDKLVAQLRTLKDVDGELLYDIWQDKTSIPPGQDWWQAIVEAIEACDVFVFMMSQESVKNINCRAELSYARKRNRPILPLVLESEFAFNPVTGKNDIDYWDYVPDDLTDGRFQFLFYEGTSYAQQFMGAVERLVSLNWPDFPADFPPDPRDTTDATNDTSLIYDEACDYAHRGEFDAAEKLFQKLIAWQDVIFAEVAHEWIVMLRDYSKMVKLDARRNTQFAVKKLWIAYVEQPPKHFLNGIFDPKQLAARYDLAPDQKVSETAVEVEYEESDLPSPAQPSDKASNVSEPRRRFLNKLKEVHSLGEDQSDANDTSIEDELAASAEAIRAIIGDPFEWCHVPAGPFLYGEDKRKLELPAFAMAKYPITYKQFQVFIDDGGFTDDRWWDGLAQRFTEPDDQRWKIDDHPRERVRWYDTMAFCRWLSARLGASHDLKQVDNWAVRLPTEFEWEKAARGEQGFIYPWGNEFDSSKCNTKESGHNRTSPVTQYPQGASPYGALDMSGNVWEWTLSDYRNPSFEVIIENISSAPSRVLRGGSWLNLQDFARAVARNYDLPSLRNNYLGFRVLRPPSL